MDTQSVDTFYDILQISQDATDKEIQQAYRRLAKILHPDVCRSPEAEELFKELNEAYSVISNPQKRMLYDATLRTGEDYHTRLQEDSRGERWYNERYKDPTTWYYKDRSTYHKNAKNPPHYAKSGNKDFKIPRWGQILLFWLTLAMAAAIISQLLILPLVNNYYQEEALIAREKGDTMFGEGEYLLAIQYYTGYLAIFPDDEDIWFQKGESEMRKGDDLSNLNKPRDALAYYYNAASSFLQAYQYSGGDVKPLRRAGELFFQMEDWIHAEEIYVTIISQTTNDEDAAIKLKEIKLRKAGFF